MSFRKGGAKRRRDQLEPQIRQALHAAGVQTWQIHGTGLPDLLCFHRRRFYALEVKGEDGRLTDAQRAIPWPIVKSIDEAFLVVGVIRT